MPTTSNFGWTTPADTDLVKDGAAAIRTLGNGIDTSFLDLKGGTTNQVLAKNSNTDLDFKWVADATGIPATIFDAKGDIIAATAADTADRLAVGANGTVLTADSTTATGLKWGSAAINESYSIINSGGTNLTGATTITVSGISGMNSLQILVIDASSANASSIFTIRLNSDSGTNYNYARVQHTQPTTYATTNFTTDAAAGGTSFEIGKMANTAGAKVDAGLFLRGCNSTGNKTVQWVGGGNAGTDGQQQWGQGVYLGTSTISSVSIISSTGNFDAGKIYVYGTA